jgi:hypothetical protein
VAGIEQAVPRIRPQNSTYLERLKAYEELRERRDRIPLVGVVSRISGGRTLLGLCIFLIAIHSLASAIGNAEALRQTHFLVLQDQPNTVVLRIYDRTLVCAMVDPNTKQVRNEFLLQENPPKTPLHLALMEVGHLKEVGARNSR